MSLDGRTTASGQALAFVIAHAHRKLTAEKP